MATKKQLDYWYCNEVEDYDYNPEDAYKHGEANKFLLVKQIISLIYQAGLSFKDVGISEQEVDKYITDGHAIPTCMMIRKHDTS